jgi:hypothetical protein
MGRIYDLRFTIYAMEAARWSACVMGRRIGDYPIPGRVQRGILSKPFWNDWQYPLPLKFRLMREGEVEEAVAAAEFQFGRDIGAVRLDGAWADEQFGSDFAAGFFHRNEL